MITLQAWRYLVVGALLVIAPGCSSAAGVCSKNEAITAEQEASGLMDWDALYASYRRYRQCDDGAIAEGYSESVTRMLDQRWSELPKLQSLVQQDGNFRTFVLRHIDQTISRDRFEAIMKNAQDRCQVDASSICGSIIERLKKL